MMNKRADSAFPEEYSRPVLIDPCHGLSGKWLAQGCTEGNQDCTEPQSPINVGGTDNFINPEVIGEGL
jgi:hypothetical protein